MAELHSQALRRRCSEPSLRAPTSNSPYWVRFEPNMRVRAAGAGLVHPRGDCVGRAEQRAVAASAYGGDEPEDTAVAAESQTMEDARAYSVWARLEREFALGVEGGSGRLLLPRHSRQRFLAFVEWVTRDEARLKTLPTILRATSVYTRQTGLTDWGADEGVRARIDAMMRREGGRRGQRV